MFEKLVSWSKQNYDHLPWRRNRSLYGTLVSEIMLQQTTVGTVLNHFESFVKKYPDLHSLATASEEQILIDWKGLGYYRRAKNLLKAAKDLNTKFHGAIPTDYDKLIQINGIGPYTANALIAIGANKKALCIDANLERVLARFYGIEVHKGPKLQQALYNLFNNKEISHEIDLLGARAYNEALMDLGRSICKARSASCEICPLSRECQALKHGKPLAYPLSDESKKTQSGLELHLLRVILEKKGKYLVYKKNENEWLSGQYEIPTFIIESEDNNLEQYPKLNIAQLKLLPCFKTGITKYKIFNYVLHADRADLKHLGIELKHFEFKEKFANLSTASLKAIDLF